MKKLLMLIIVSVMVIMTLTAPFANAALFDYEPDRVDSGLCAIGGGILGGVIGHQLIGKDPATIVLALVGGAIGYDYCTNYVNNPRYQALKNLIREGFGQRPGPRSFKAETNEFVAAINIVNYGSKSELFSERKCVEFESSIYRGGRNGPFMGRVQPLWACENRSGDYEIMRTNHGIYIDTFSSSSDSSIGHDGSGSGGVSRGFYSQNSHRWKRLDYSEFRTQTRVKDQNSGRMRPVTMMNRKLEYGFFAGRGLNRDGFYAIKISTDIAAVGAHHNYTSTPAEADVAVECNELNYCVAFDVENLNFRGMKISGRAQYIFPNGDMVVIDSVNGNRVIPREVLLNY